MAQKKQSGLGIASLVLGIGGAMTTCIIVGIIPCFIGLILAIISLCDKSRRKETAIAGLVCSICGIVIFILFLFLFITNIGVDGNMVGDRTIRTEEVLIENSANTGNVEEQETSVADPENNVELFEKEILFCDVPWGTSYTKTDELLGELGMWSMSGENFKTMSVDDIVLRDYKGIDFEYSDINIISPTHNGEISVAGYMTSSVYLYFAFVPVDGVLTKTEEDSALYGAQYKFDTKNLQEMSTDLNNKLVSLYGPPQKENSDSDLWGNKYKYTYWYGANDTAVVLRTVDTSNDSTNLYEDEIVISYVWLEGDRLLQEASDILKKEAIEKEAEAYGNHITDGL